MLIQRNLRTAVVLLFLTGCAGLGGYSDGIRVSVADIKVLETSLMEQLYQVSLRVQNRNPKPLTVQGGSFDMEINGKDFGSGVTDSQVRIEGYSDALVEVRMVSSLFGMLRLFRSFEPTDAPRLEYEISGRIAVEEVTGGLRFRESGEFELPRGHGSAAP